MARTRTQWPPRAPTQTKRSQARTAVVPRAASRSEPKRSAKPVVCLPVGKGNKKIKVTPGGMCLTPSQVAWAQPEKLIGCGSFACAYERPDGKVIKLTSDPADISNMIDGQAHPRVVRLYDSRRLKNTRRSRKTYYGAIVEKLQPDQVLSKIVDYLPIELLDASYDWKAKRGKTDSSYVVDDGTKKSFAYKCDQLSENKTACHAVAEGLISLHEFFGQRGVRFVDLHGGNVARNDQGAWRVLDVGYARTRKPKVPLLAQPGLRGRRR